MFLLVGLGNPGRQYEQTRHNAGFIALDHMIEQYGLSSMPGKFQAQLWKGTIGEHVVLAIKPQTFMNKSGESVGAAARFYKIPPERVIVFYDDLDLVPGKMRIKCGGGHGGHNGLKDIDRVFGKDYWRVRLGIGHPGDKDRVTGYVLGRLSDAEKSIMDALAQAVARHVPLMLDDQSEKMMTAVAREMQAQEKA